MVKGNNEIRLQPLAKKTITQMMKALVRRKQVMGAVRPQLKDIYFFDDEAHWGLLWDVLCEWWDETEQLPAETELLGDVEQAINDNPELLSHDEQRHLRIFISRTFKVPIKQIKAQWAIDKFSVFIQERIKREMIDELDKRTIPANFGGWVADVATQLDQVGAMGYGESEKPFGANFEMRPIHKFPTGVDFLDNFLGGGQAVGECNVIIGPYGSCKTTLAVQLTCETASYFWTEHIQNEKKKPLKLAYMFFYEGTKLEMQQRFLVYVAKIHKDTMENFEDPEDFSTTGDLKAYEEEMYKTQIRAGKRVPGERERMLKAQKIIDRNIRFIDCTGNDPNFPGRGTNLVPEIASVLHNDVRRMKSRGLEPGFVIVDHVSAAVERHVSGGGGKYDHLRNYTGKFPINMANQVAIPFDIPTWLMHQTGTQAQSKAPGYTPHHTDAADARNFGENAAFAFNLGTTDPSNKCIISCSKSRRRPPREHEIVQINGAFGRVIGTDNKWTINKATGKFVEAADLKRVTQQTEGGERPKPTKVVDPRAGLEV